MQYQEDLAGSEDEQPKQVPETDKSDQVPHTGDAPLSGGGDMDTNKEQGIRVELSYNQKDALRELGNIGASHAATTLSTMLNTPIMLNVPEICITDFEHINQLISQENSAMGIFTMEGQMAKAGYVILHVPRDSVVQMTSIMLGMPIDQNRDLNEMDESAITEIGNIMVSAFLDGTAELLGIIMLPSPPRTIFDTPKNVFDLIIKESNILYDNVVFFRTELICDEHELNLNIFMLPNPPVLQEIVRMLEKLIEDSAMGQ
jgi:chemotaxis protein CheY-P-specific phosphatase CheC